MPLGVCGVCIFEILSQVSVTSVLKCLIHCWFWHKYLLGVKKKLAPLILPFAIKLSEGCGKEKHLPQQKY